MIELATFIVPPLKFHVPAAFPHGAQNWTFPTGTVIVPPVWLMMPGAFPPTMNSSPWAVVIPPPEMFRVEVPEL